MNKEELIPPHREGVSTDTEETASLSSAEEAGAFYQVVRRRLLDVNQWHQLAGTGSAFFQLTDERGRDKEGTAAPGDHFRIDIPAPGSLTGAGSDWVRIEKIEEERESVVMQVRPATNPRNEAGDIAHFFSGEATSSFIVRREGNEVIAGVHGRNEKPNTNTETVTDKLRNALVATGAIGGFSKLQWKGLVKGLVAR
jgi:hypothetical protein